MKPTFRQFIEDIEVDRYAYTRGDSDETIDSKQRSINQNYDPQKAEKPYAVWKKLPVKFPHEGFEVVYRKDRYGEFDIGLVDVRELPKLPFFNPAGNAGKHRLAINLNVGGSKVKLLNNAGKIVKLHGVKTDVLSGADSYRGFGLAPMLYQALVEHGQVLFSSTTQTPGGQSTWRRLVKNLEGQADIGVIIHADDAERLVKKHGKENPELMKALMNVYAKTSHGKATLGDGDKPDLEDVLEAHEGQLLILGDRGMLDKHAYGHDGTYWVVAPRGTLADFTKHALKIQ